MSALGFSRLPYPMPPPTYRPAATPVNITMYQPIMPPLHAAAVGQFTITSVPPATPASGAGISSPLHRRLTVKLLEIDPDVSVTHAVPARRVGSLPNTRRVYNEAVWPRQRTGILQREAIVRRRHGWRAGRGILGHILTPAAARRRVLVDAVCCASLRGDTANGLRHVYITAKRKVVVPAALA